MINQNDQQQPDTSEREHEERIREIADRFMDRYDRAFRELADTN